MARDYAKPAQQPKKRPPRNQRAPQRPGPPPWAAFAGGVGAGLVVALLAVLLWRPATDDKGVPTVPADAAEAPAADAGEDPAKPRFDFYTLLKETEVFVPEVEEQALTAAPPDKPERDKAAPDKALDAGKPAAQPPAPPAAEPQAFEFVLQVGSFRSRPDADNLRARLLLLGLKAGIESAGSRPGEVWHRVMIGPFDSPAALAQARARLQANGIDHIPVKRKQP
ncbi:MAG: SPOR domain-containing protein [Pseudomonadales bacterium]|nr:SPOR domain-containing protein [Pseudomonadales bacterium]